MKKGNNKIRTKVDAAKSRLETQTFKIGKMSLRLSSTLIYIACLLCALFIWANVYESSAVTASRRFDNVSVVIEGENTLGKNDLAVFELIDKTVSITVEGAENKVNELTDDDIVAFIDVGRINESGTARLSVNIDGIGKLSASSTPSSVKVFVDKRSEISIPLKINPTYSIMTGYDFTVSSSIAEVTVSGAKSILDTVKEARCEPNFGELVSSTKANAPIIIVDDNGAQIESDYIVSDSSSVVVEVEVSTEKTVPLTYSFKHGYIKDRNIKVSLSQNEVVLRGDPSVLSGINSISLIEIDETKLNDSTEMVVSPLLPGGVKFSDSENRFEVKIDLIKCSEKTISVPVGNFQVKNPKGLSFKFEKEAFDLNYIVDTNSAKKVSLNSFNFTLDLSAISADADGRYAITPTVTAVDGGYTLYPISLGQLIVDVAAEEENG